MYYQKNLVPYNSDNCGLTKEETRNYFLLFLTGKKFFQKLLIACLKVNHMAPHTTILINRYVTLPEKYSKIE